MMIDWNKYHQQFGARVGELMKLSPDTVKGYQTLSAANSANSKLGEKTRQLISLAVAITTRTPHSRLGPAGKRSPRLWALRWE